MCLVKSEFYKRTKKVMNWNQVKVVLGQVAIIVAGVLVANQVQKQIDKGRVATPPKTES